MKQNHQNGFCMDFLLKGRPPQSPKGEVTTAQPLPVEEAVQDAAAVKSGLGAKAGLPLPGEGRDGGQYTELQITTNFSFLRGASHPDELVEQAALLSYNTIAITDRNTVAGVVRAHAAGKKKGVRVIPGCRLDLIDGSGLLAYPMNSKGWTNLCSLLSTGNLRAEKGECHLYKKDVFQYSAGLYFIALSPEVLNEDFCFLSLFICIIWKKPTSAIN